MPKIDLVLLIIASFLVYCQIVLVIMALATFKNLGLVPVRIQLWPGLLAAIMGIIIVLT